MKQPLTYVGLGALLARNSARVEFATIALVVIIGSILNPHDAIAFGEEPIPTMSAPANEEKPMPVSAVGATVPEEPNLTGNWWGARDTFSSHGITLDVSLTQFYQGVVGGGNERDFEYGGKLDYYVALDGSKAGLWPGFSITTHVETRYGEDVNTIDGMLAFGNFNMAFPKVGQTGTGVTALKLTQLLFERLLLIAGKINTLDDFRLNFTGRNGLERFMDSAVVANIINARTIPYSTYGAGFAAFVENGPEFTFLVRDPDDHATRADLDQLFAHGAVLTGSLRMPVALMGLAGTQVIGGNWSSRHYSSLDASSWINVPGQGLVAPEESASWAIYYNFDQYLWVSRSNANTWLGIFGMFGISDGNPNPIRWNATFGIGGGGLIPGRERDRFGLGYFYIRVSDELKDLLSEPPAPPGLAQHDEQGVELYYNAALASWCYLAVDLQIAQPSTKRFDTTLLFGTRLKIDF
jgi:porin